jgi:hypothetical protein
MKRLGYLSFASNEGSNFKARELKSVHVATPAQLLRLVFHKCHINKLNIYNQVCLPCRSLAPSSPTRARLAQLMELKHARRVEHPSAGQTCAGGGGATSAKHISRAPPHLLRKAVALSYRTSAFTAVPLVESGTVFGSLIRLPTRRCGRPEALSTSLSARRNETQSISQA